MPSDTWQEDELQEPPKALYVSVVGMLLLLFLSFGSEAPQFVEMLGFFMVL